MKHCSTLAFFLFCLAGYAQEPFFQPLTQWDAPEISEKLLQNANISSIKIHSYERSSLRARPVSKGQQVSLLTEKGTPLQVVETGQKGTDTVQITTYHYNKNNTLWRKVVDDRVWNRQYRSGYRCTRSQQFFQVRSYELLNAQERMLLSSRQYLYRDGQLEAIELRENGRVVQVHRFQYNKNGSVKEERLEDAAQKVLKSVSYTYGPTHLITEVQTRESHGALSRYQYTYNEQGLPKQVEWFEGDNKEAKGIAFYEYDQRGLLKSFNRVMYPRTPQQKSTMKRYTYETFPLEEDASEDAAKSMIATH